ncbi:MAG: rhomboid family intramembrane serine protease [Bacteroidales bacterium]|nr:rhomboid family intramembrane serine protease [Bacteroidales bacterium]
MNSFRNGNSFLSSIPMVTKNLVIINLIFWIASILYPAIQDFLGLHFFMGDKFKPHQLLTYMFMHDRGNFGHVFFNMFAVVMFGRILEQAWGPKRFLLFYVITGIGAGLVQQLTWYIDLRPFLQDVNNYLVSGEIGSLGKYWQLQEGVTYPAQEVLRAKEALLDSLLTIGASGSVFGILLGFGMLFPNAPIYIMFIPVPVKAKWMVIGYGVLELFAGVSNFSGDNVAHFAHLGGMLFGYFLIVYWKKKGLGNDIFLG